MSEFALNPQEETFSLDETLQALRERVSDFVGRLAARAGFADLENDMADAGETHTVYAEGNDEKKEEPPKRPEPKVDQRPIGHDPATCTVMVCSACNKLGHPK